MQTTDERLAIPLSEVWKSPLIPWGRDRVMEHADADPPLLPTFMVGRRRFVARDDLDHYIENLKAATK